MIYSCVVWNFSTRSGFYARKHFENLELENVTQMSNQLIMFLLPGLRKILPHVDMWAEKKKYIWFLFNDLQLFFYEFLYFHFVNVCNAKSWNCSTKMIKKKRKRMSRLRKIDLAIIGQTLLRNQSIGKNGQNWKRQKFPRFDKTWR